MPQDTRSTLRPILHGELVIRILSTWSITARSRTMSVCRLLHQSPHRRRSTTPSPGPGSLLATSGPRTGSVGHPVLRHPHDSPDYAAPRLMYHLCMRHLCMHDYCMRHLCMHDLCMRHFCMLNFPPLISRSHISFRAKSIVLYYNSVEN